MTKPLTVEEATAVYEEGIVFGWNDDTQGDLFERVIATAEALEAAKRLADAALAEADSNCPRHGDGCYEWKHCPPTCPWEEYRKLAEPEGEAKKVKTTPRDRDTYGWDPMSRTGTRPEGE